MVFLGPATFIPTLIHSLPLSRNKSGADTHSLSYSYLQARNPALRPDTDQFKSTIVDGSIKTEGIVSASLSDH